MVRVSALLLAVSSAGLEEIRVQGATLKFATAFGASFSYSSISKRPALRNKARGNCGQNRTVRAPLHTRDCQAVAHRSDAGCSVRMGPSAAAGSLP